MHDAPNRPVRPVAETCHLRSHNPTTRAHDRFSYPNRQFSFIHLIDGFAMSNLRNVIRSIGHRTALICPAQPTATY